MKRGPRSHRVPSVLAVAGAVVLAALALTDAGAQQQPRFETTVEVVQLQVEVQDEDGNHVPDLEAADFSLEVEDDPRDLVAVYEVDLGSDQVTDSGVLPPAGWRQFLLFFDFTFASRQGISRARDAALEFVSESTHPLDLVGVATYSRVNGLRLLVPFTADHVQVRDAVRAFGLDRGNHIVDPLGFAVEPLADLSTPTDDSPIASGAGGLVDDLLEETILQVSQADLRRYTDEVTRFATQLGALGNMLQAARGRKHVVLFSAGFDDEVLTGQSLEEMAAAQNEMASDPGSLASTTQFGSGDLRATLDEALEQLRVSGAVFHVVDSSGLGESSNRQGLNYLASGTDGSVIWNRNELAGSLDELSEETSRYYVLAYRKAEDDPPVVKLEVDVSRPGARIAAAPKRFAPPPSYADMDPAQRQLQLAEYVSKGIEEEDVPLRLRAVPFAGRDSIQRLAVILEIPFEQLREIADARGDGSAELDILGYSLDESNSMRDLFTRRLTLNVDRIASGMGEVPFRYYDLLWAMPGPHRVRVLVRDTEVGRLSTRTEAVDVPTFGSASLATSGAVPVDLEHPGMVMRGLDPASPPEHKSGGPVAYPFTVGDQEITPAAAGVASPGGIVQCHLVVYNLARHPFTGQPQMGLSARLVDGLGGAQRLDRVAIVGRHVDAEAGATSLLLEIGIPSGVDPATYRIDVTIVDGINGQSVVQSMPVTVVGGGDVAVP